MRKITSNKNRKYLHRNTSYIMKIEKVDKQISFPKPKLSHYIHPLILLNI